MRRSKWARRLSCAALVTAVIAGAAIAAGSQGSQDDPLVTLSYLNEVAVPEIMKQVDEKIAKSIEELEARLREEGSSAAFRTVEVKKGQTVALSAGCQVLVRSGSVNSTDALVDLTTGETWRADGSLRENHLYIATGDKQTLTAAGAAVLMVQGSLEIE